MDLFSYFKDLVHLSGKEECKFLCKALFVRMGLYHVGVSTVRLNVLL